MGMIGAVLVALLLLVTVFADFLSPYNPVARNPDAIYSPPQSLHFFSDDGFHLIPFTNPVVTEIDPQTFAAVTKVDTGDALPARIPRTRLVLSAVRPATRPPSADGAGRAVPGISSAPTATAATCCRGCWSAAS